MAKKCISKVICQMNFSDSEIVASIFQMLDTQLQMTKHADLVLVNTCSIREKQSKLFVTIRAIQQCQKKQSKPKSWGIGLYG